VVAGRAEYENAIKKLFPQGAYWDAQFADAESGASLFVKAKLDGLVRFRERMDALVKESVIETTDELIAEWERVLLGYVTAELPLNERRLLLKSKRDVKLDRSELRKTAAMFGLTLLDVSFPFRPAFFGHSYFNTSTIGSPVTFSVLLIKAGRGKANFWELIKAEYPAKRFTRLRFGHGRLVYFPARQLRLNVNKKLRESAFAFNKAGIERLFPSPSCKYKTITESRFRASSAGFMRCGSARLVYSPVPAMRGIVSGCFQSRGMGFARFGGMRLAYSAAYTIRRFVRKYWRSVSTGLARFGRGRLLYIPLDALRGMTARNLRAFRFASVCFGSSRLAYYEAGFQNSLLRDADTASVFGAFYRRLLADSGIVSRADAALVTSIIGVSKFPAAFGAELAEALVREDGVKARFDAWFMSGTMRSADFYLRFEQVLIDRFVTVKKIFEAFEKAIGEKLLANQMPYFNYEGE
jgi:hypothetical protein